MKLITASPLNVFEIFSDVSPGVKALIASASSVRRCKNAESIFERGDTASCLYVVESGTVGEEHRISPEHSRLDLFGTGQVFGELSFGDNACRTSRAYAIRKCEVVEIPYQTVQIVLRDNPELLWGVNRFLAQRLRETNHRVSNLHFGDVLSRTARALLQIAGEEDSFVLPISQEQLADFAGVSRTRTTKAISSFIRLGWLKQLNNPYRNPTFQILDRSALEERCLA